ncbi:hypothetical protein ABZ608_41500 [Streptomyces sp. NPDC013172]|uniref:Uncharacterized protein n=1 Tax=Streptomyces atriruber TaxID=545121 RepID=A0ABV3C2S0_9ACTN
MRALLAGALLGLLIALFPSVLTLAATVAFAAAVKALPPALFLGLAARLVLAPVRRWSR